MYSVKKTALVTAKRSPGNQERHTHKVKCIAAIAATAMLGGCAGWSKDHTRTGSVPSDYRTNHPIVVADSEVFEDLAISSKKRDLSLRDRNVVREFAYRYKNSGAKYLRMILPVGSPNERAAISVSRQIAEEINEVGVRSGSIKLASYHASGHGESATIRLSFQTLTASVQSKCGVWDDDLSNTSENKNYTNFGCATQNNLAAMVSNPSDLIGPRGISEIDATRRNQVIVDWRENGSGELPALLSEG